jgi:hypothetical protein
VAYIVHPDAERLLLLFNEGGAAQAGGFQQAGPQAVREAVQPAHGVWKAWPGGSHRSQVTVWPPSAVLPGSAHAWQEHSMIHITTVMPG